MKKKPEKLTIYQKLRIKEIASPYVTVHELSEKIGAPYQRVYVYVVMNNIPCKMKGQSILRQKFEGTKLSLNRKFNVLERENWLV